MPLSSALRIAMLRPALSWLLFAQLRPLWIAAIITAAAAGWLLVAPASAFLHDTSLQLVAPPALDPFVMLRGRLGGFLDVPVHFRIEVREIRGVTQALARCTASGVWTRGADAFGEMRVSLAGPGSTPCRLLRGFAYDASAVWRFTVLGVEKTAEQRTGALVMPVAPPLLDPLIPPGL